METGTSPAEPPPPGLHSNLINPPSSTDISLVVLVLCIALTTPLVLLRIYTRAFMERKVWWDDGKFVKSLQVAQAPLTYPEALR